MMPNDITNKLKGLTEEERKLALTILHQIATDGQSSILEDLKYNDFDEIPVDIETFLDDDKYLAKGIWMYDEISGQKYCTLFPY